MHEINLAPPIYKDKTPEAQNVELAKLGVKNVNTTAVQVQKLADQLTEAHAALDQACNRFRVDTTDWIQKDLPAAAKLIREVRMAMTTEFSALLKHLEDLRKFFVGPTYETEMARLREFIYLCERLQKLKASGFLDSVADTMLKLAQ